MNSQERNLTPWDIVKIARHKNRPNASFYIRHLCDKFIECHGDRFYGDDKAVIGGIALIEGIKVTVIAICKGEDLMENVARNFGMPHPEGYRKALRLMKQAEKFKRPVICFIDTPGAFCGVDAEERGQGRAIAVNLLEMSRLRTPIISIILGEGGSGGALALGIADSIWMLEYAIYSILSPEGFSTILWKDPSKTKKAAEAMKLTSKDLLAFNMIDKVIEEPQGGAHNNSLEMARVLKDNILSELKFLKDRDIGLLIKDRNERIRNMGRPV